MLRTTTAMFLKFLAILSLFCVQNGSADFVLTAPAFTDLGEWEKMVECPADSFVVAADSTYDQVVNPEKKDDHLGLVNVVLECRNVFAPKASQKSTFIHTIVKGVTATVDKAGSNTSGEDSDPGSTDPAAGNVDEGIGREKPKDIKYTLPLKMQCEGIAIGIELNSAEFEVASDNTGLNNIRLHCSGLVGNTPDFVEGYGRYKGEWSEPQMCGPTKAICGIQSQSDNFNAITPSYDHFGINNLRFKCCRIPNPASTCVPSDTWEIVEQCDNYYGMEDITCSYVKQIGIGASSTKSIELYDQYLINEGVGYNLPTEYEAFWLSAALSENFRTNLKISNVTKHDWEKSSERTWVAETTSTYTFQAVKMTKATIYQVVGRCGYFSARTSSFMKFDETYQP